MERTLTTQDLVRIYGKTVVTIYNWVKAGVPHEKVIDGMNKVYRFNQQEVEEWLRSR